MPYVERDEAGEIVCLYGAVAPMFAQARTYLSTGKLQERLDEYPDVQAEADRLGVSFDEAVGHADDIHDPDKQWTICGRWPEWVDDAELDGRSGNPLPAGTLFPEDVPLEAIREAYEESHAEPDPGADQVGDSGDPDDLAGGAGVDGDDAGDDPLPELESDPAANESASGDMAEPDDVSAPVDHGGVMVAGDPLKVAQMELTWAVGDKEDELISQYPADENLARLNELRGIALAIKEGVHPAFDEETAAELQALETFASWLSAVRLNADRLRNAIRIAGDLDALALIDINSGWPE